MHELIIKTNNDLEHVANDKHLSLQVLEKTQSIIKARLIVETDVLIQVYVNAKKIKISYALIMNNQRTYAKDCIYGEWHTHPFMNSQVHDISETGKHPVELAEFVEAALFNYYSLSQ
jgi:hypothetical protein